MSQRLVIGSYTAEMNGAGVGLSIVEDGRVIDHLATVSPSYVIADPTLPVLYAVNEVPDGAVTSYALTDSLRPLSTQPTGGVWPCHLTLFDGHLIATNYGSGSISVHPVDPSGIIDPRTDLVAHSGHSADPARQEGPHTHQSQVAADGVVTVVDLGLDQLIDYRLQDGSLTRIGSVGVPPGSGPRHYVTHSSGARYVAAELSSTVLTIRAGTAVTSVPATASAEFNQPSAIVLSGAFVYVANRGPDTIATFRVSPTDELSFVDEVSCGGHWPRDMVLNRGQLIVANERSHGVVTFDLDDVTGLPSASGDVWEIGSPTCVLPVTF